MKKAFLIILTVYLLGACASIPRNIEEAAVDTVWPDGVQTTSRFRVLWDSLSAYQTIHRSLTDYVPSSHLITLCNLKKQNQTYFVTGYLKTRTSIDTQDLSRFAHTVVSYNDSLHSFNIPITSLKELVYLKHLVYIDLSTKVKPQITK